MKDFLRSDIRRALGAGGVFHMHLLSLSAASGERCGHGADAGKDPGEELTRNRHLRHQKDRPSGMIDDPRPYLDQLELHASERPAGYLPGKGEAPEEVAQKLSCPGQKPFPSSMCSSQSQWIIRSRRTPGLTQEAHGASPSGQGAPRRGLPAGLPEG